MASGSGDSQPLSLRPFPVAAADKTPQSIADFIARINNQSGGFRSVTEDQLQREIEAEANGQQQEDEDVDMSDSEGGNAEADATKDPAAVRMEVLRNVDIAGNAAMVTLESISLLLSKQNPTTASTTLSQQLRDLVGIGTLGSDRLDASNLTPDMIQDKQTAAVGMTLMEINQTRDSAEEATKFLQKEMEAEGKYWEEVMKVQSSGWSISRMPHERHTLGVRFGFSEATPEFRAHGLAPIRRSDDGSVSLDASHLGGGSERLHVTYLQGGRVVGRSSRPPAVADDASLEERVRDARDTIFAKELWHELTKESKTLAAYDVQPIGSSALAYSIDDNTSITLEVKSLDSYGSSDDEGSLPYDGMAEMISIAVHILLSFAHRSNELMRVRPLPPQIPRSRGAQPHALLRPIIARLQSTQNIKSCTAHVGLLTQALRKAGLPATFVLHTPQPEVGTPPSGPNQPGAAQLLVRSLLQPVEFSLKTTILRDTFLTVRGRTFTLPATTTTYQVILPDSSPLQKLCPPYKEGYPDVRSLADYLRTATTRLLANHALTILPSPSWTRSVKGTSLHLPSPESKGDLELRFLVEGGEEGKGTAAPVVVMEKTQSADFGKSDKKRWEWRAEGASESAKLEEILRDIGSEAA